MPRQAGFREVISTRPGPSGRNGATRGRVLGVVEHQQPPLPHRQIARAAAPPRRRSSRSWPTSPGVGPARPAASATSAGSSAGIHQARSNSSRWRWAYSIAVVVLPTPPIPVTACTTARPRVLSAASSSVNSSARPVNSAHPRRDRPQPARTPNPRPPSAPRTSAAAGTVRVNACSSAVSNSPGSRHRRGGHAAVGQPGPERVLARPVLQIDEHLRRALAYPRRAGTPAAGYPAPRPRLVLQLRVGHLRPIAHRRPVPKPGDQHEHIRVGDAPGTRSAGF